MQLKQFYNLATNVSSDLPGWFSFIVIYHPEARLNQWRQYFHNVSNNYDIFFL